MILILYQSHQLLTTSDELFLLDEQLLVHGIISEHPHPHSTNGSKSSSVQRSSSVDSDEDDSEDSEITFNTIKR